MAVKQRAGAAAQRWVVALVLVFALLAAAGCHGPTGKTSSTTSAPQPVTLRGTQVISYAGATARLSALDPGEAQEQLRDWARAGLASLLGLDTARLRDADYDTVPVRDPAFADLAQKSTGPGRSLYDGRGVLHLLVPQGDPHEDRTVGLLLDDYRTNSGADPKQVVIHHYQVDASHLTIDITSQDPLPASEVRKANGYVEMRVDDTQALTAFLAQTQSLSLLEKRSDQIWAAGWRWPDVQGGQLSYEDVSVIQRGYQESSSGQRPGFSLDPGPNETVDDVLAVAPGLDHDLAQLVVQNERNRLPDQPSSGFPPFPHLVLPTLAPLPALPGFQDVPAPSLPTADELKAALDDALFDGKMQSGLPTDRAQLWALLGRLDGDPLYSQARYDGRLEGTEVGMTLFYTDHIAKDWVAGVGSGIPTKAVQGFVPDSSAVIPWSQCPPPDSESGRLWFGENESGFSFDDNQVSIGARATRLFERSDGPGNSEVEPSYGFGRGLRWWDQHFTQVADYEPQYQRLDQIMRWSGALEWLVTRKNAQLPHLDDSQIRSNLHFKDWYATHNELREREPIEFVTPPSATQESVLAEPSAPYSACGKPLPYIEGGVSLGNLLDREGSANYSPDLPSPVRRAGLFDEGSTYDPAKGTGHMKQVSLNDSGQVDAQFSLERTLSVKPDGRAVVDTVGGGRAVASLGDLKVVRAETATRQLTVEIAAGPNENSQTVILQGHELGQQVARKVDVATVTIQWRPGALDRLRQGLDWVQERLAGHAPGPGPMEGVLYGYQAAPGQPVYRIGEQDWLSVAGGQATPGEELVLRLGAPDQKTGQADQLDAHFQGPPAVQSAWVDVTPAAPGFPAMIAPADPPGPDALRVPISTPDGKSTVVRMVGNRPRVARDDPILGVNGAAVGAALLRDFPSVQAAAVAALTAGDGLLRAVPLGYDGVAFAGADHVVIASADHPWAEQALLAIDPAHPELTPPFRIDGNRLLSVDTGTLALSGTPRRMSLGQLLDHADPSRAIYVDKGTRSLFATDQGPIVPDALARKRQVVVREAAPTGPLRSASQPDVRVHEGRDWYRVTGPFGGSGGVGSGGPGSGQGSASGPGGAVLSGQLVLVCPAPSGSKSTPTNSTDCDFHDARKR